jgi:hypothetical protein
LVGLCTLVHLGPGLVETLPAAQVSLAWDPSVEPDIAGYKVYFGRVSRSQTESVGVGNTTAYTVMGLLEGTTYYFAATAYDPYGRESVFSNEVSTTTPICAYATSPTSQSFTAAVGSGTVTVTATAGCSWTASEAVSWITITSGNSGTGSGTVGYSVMANTGAARSATMTIAGRTLTISQAAAPCSYATSPTSQSFTKAAGSGTVTVTATAGCSWTASEAVSWITITSGNSGTGSGTVGYSVMANTGAARSATMTIAGRTLTISQAAAPPLTVFTITAWRGAGGTISPSGAVSVQSGASCAFTVNPASGYRISSVYVDGASKGAVSSFTFYNVIANHTIIATFQQL